MLNVARGGRDDVEVVEQPLRCGRHRLAARFFCKRVVGAAERLHVRRDLAKVRTAAPAAARLDREQRREMPGVLLEELDAEELDAATSRRGSDLCLGVGHDA